MPIQSLDDYANSGKLYHVERIKRMMESFDDVILKRFFRAALARLEDEDEPDEEEEENIYQQQVLFITFKQTI
uniref:Uncharacterized protein n=1 Tax=Acrobeloides nanus TaxID=290746 RepID=A0A914D6X6_9BILA